MPWPRAAPPLQGNTSEGMTGAHGININQITWQTGALSEVIGAYHYFNEREVPIMRVGRDMPGSNWHVYCYDPDGHVNELYYGIEQEGWNGRSKPRDMYYRGFREEARPAADVRGGRGRRGHRQEYRHPIRLPKQGDAAAGVRGRRRDDCQAVQDHEDRAGQPLRQERGRID